MVEKTYWIDSNGNIHPFIKKIGFMRLNLVLITSIFVGIYYLAEKFIRFSNFKSNDITFDMIITPIYKTIIGLLWMIKKK